MTLPFIRQLKSLVMLGIALILFSTTAAAAEVVTIEFNTHIRPILSDKCFACHGPDEAERQGGLRLDQRESAFGEADSGAIPIVPGEPEASELIHRILSEDEDLQMPPSDSLKQLSDEEIGLLRQWIEQRADWQEHWAFIPPQRKELPPVSDASWPRGPIDHFILAKLDQENLQPSPITDKATLLRRVTFDLTGLPPTLAEIEAFLADDSPEAYEQVVDRLLESPHYGEHMARFWLDAARYGDTHGLHLDNYREIWPYRDWVIGAFNDNLPYDQFTIQQLAGDLLPDPSLDQLIATGFCRCNVTTNEGGSIKEEVYMRNVVDRVVTTGTVFLGLTFECTRCHDHKFDPLTQRDFYSMFAFFNSLDGPVMDGNVKDPKPTVHAPSIEQAQQLDKLHQKMDQLSTQANEYRKEAKLDFQEWYQRMRQQQNLQGTLDFQPPTAGLLGHYSLELLEENKVTNAVDSSAADSSNGGEARGNVKVVSGRYGNGIELGEGGHVDLGNVFNFRSEQHFSITAWVQMPENATGAILSKTTKKRRGYALTIEDGYLTFALTNHGGVSSVEVTSEKKSLAQKGWHHVAVSYDASAKAAGVVIWVDGKRQKLVVSMDSLIVNEAVKQIDSDDAHLQIGRLGEKKPFLGVQVDEVRFYDRSLSQADVICVMLAERIAEILAQPTEQATETEWQELRDYYFHRFDSKHVGIIDQGDQLALEETAIQHKVPATLVFRDRKTPRQAFVLNRGEYDQPGEPVERATPAVLPPMSKDVPQNRLGLAQWLVNAKNPLTSRVTVNRFWAQFFGMGIVKTAEDFGAQGGVPSHPGLLDWLAVEFIESGWDVKAMVKRIVLSNTYGQSSRISAHLVERDPENRLLARGPRYRLDAEMLRDQALAVSGLLVNQLGGPSVKPPQPDGLWFSVGYSGSNTVRFVADTGREKIHRRTMYTFLKRTSLAPQLSTFDAPSRESCSVRRDRTNTPLQALLLLNDPQFIDAARGLAERVMRESGSDPQSRIQTMIRICTGHPASQSMVDELVSFYNLQYTRYQADGEAAKALILASQLVKESESENQLDPNQLAAWTVVANLVLNLDEVVTKN